MSSRSGQNKDATNVLAFNDSIANAQTFIDPIHRRIHLGQYWTYSYVELVVAFLGAQSVRIDNPDQITYHMSVRAGHGGLAEGRLQIYENAVFDLALEPVPPVNHNRSSLSTTALAFDKNSNFVSGTLLFDTVVPAIEEFETKEWIMDPVQAGGPGVAVVFTSLDASGNRAQSINIDFYEDDA